MRDAYIVQSVRTPGCKQRRGKFKEPARGTPFIYNERGGERTPGLNFDDFEDVMCGCAFPKPSRA